MRLPIVVLIAAALAVAGCQRRGCSNLVVEIAVPHGGAPAVTRIDLITPGSMSGTGIPKVSRIEDQEDIYAFSTLAFDHEDKRTLSVRLANGITAAFPIPEGRQQPTSFTIWSPPAYVTGAEDSGSANWQIMHGTATARMPAGQAVRARYQFEAYECSR
jgi:hypothetical protein